MTEKLRSNNDLPQTITELITFYETKLENCKETLLNKDFSNKEDFPNNFSEEQYLKILQTRIIEIEKIITYLKRYGNNPEIQKITEELKTFFENPNEARNQERKSLFERLAYIIEDSNQDSANRREKLMDSVEVTLKSRLTQEQIKFLDSQSFANHPEALMDIWLYWRGYDAELTSKLVALPKDARDRAVEKLESELEYYQYVISDEFAQKSAETLSQSADQILDNQSSYFEGLRGAIQKGIDDMINNPTLSYLISPINYNPEDVEKIKEVVMTKIKNMQTAFNVNHLQELQNQCKELKNIEKDFLTKDEIGDFLDALNNFRKSTTLPEVVTESHRELLGLAYILSHGDKNSIFSPDITIVGKVTQNQEGYDFLREMRCMLPFRWGLSDSTSLRPFEERFAVFEEIINSRSAEENNKMSYRAYDKEGKMIEITGWEEIKKAGYAEAYFRQFHHGDIEEVKIPSYWELDYWLENPNQSVAAQTVAGLAIAKIPSMLLSAPMRQVWQIYFGIKIGEGINEANINKNDRYFLGLIKEYESIDAMPPEAKAKLRSFVIRNEIQKIRKKGQAIGADLDKYNLTLWDKFFLGAIFGSTSNFDFNFTADSMQQEGTLQKAIELANKKLILMNLEPALVEQ